MSDFDFRTPQQQHILAVVVYFFKNLRRLVNALIPLIAVVAVRPNAFLILAVALIVGVVLNCVFAWLQHKNFIFYLENHELIIHRGVFTKERMAIPLERVQSVQLHQNVIQKLLKLTAVKVDTAGSKAEELEIPALETYKARALQEMLRIEKQKIAENVTSEADVEQPRQIEEETSIELVKLGIFKLLKVGITENHIRRGFIVLAIIFGYVSQYQKIIDSYLEPWIQENYMKVAQFSITLILIAIAVFIILSAMLSIIITVLKHYNFKASLQGQFFDIEEGLLKRNEYRIPIKKVQFLEWRSNPLRKLWDIETVRIFQSQSVLQDRKKAIEIPACEERETRIILEEVFDEDHEAQYSTLPTKKTAFVLLNLYIFGTPILLAAAGTIFLEKYYETAGILFLFLPLLLISYKNAQKMGIQTNGKLLIIRKGWIFPVRVVIPIYKIQALQFKQSIFLNRRNLAHFKILTASGDRSVKFLNAAEVRILYDYLLAEVELYKGSWM